MIISTETDLRAALCTVSQTGAAFLVDAIQEEALSAVAAELESAPYTRLPEQQGRARQEGEILVLTSGSRGYPAMSLLCERLTAAILAAGDGICGLDQWRPNEVAVQRYPERALGITPHRDLQWYRYLVVVVTVEGTAEFMLCKNREGELLDTWQAGSGSLVLLRGPGLGGTEEGGPLHAVAGPAVGHRTSLGLRMDTRLPIGPPLDNA